jgi:hypothetical protein
MRTANEKHKVEEVAFWVLEGIMEGLSDSVPQETAWGVCQFRIRQAAEEEDVLP